VRAFSVRLRYWCIRSRSSEVSAWSRRASYLSPGVIGVASQATVLGVVTLWIATRQSRVSRVVGGLILAVLSTTLTYGMIFGPMWKVNVLIVATIALTWIFGLQRRELVRA